MSAIKAASPLASLHQRRCGFDQTRVRAARLHPANVKISIPASFSSNDVCFVRKPMRLVAVNSNSSSSGSSSGAGESRMTVDALAKMLEDPEIQKMLLPYLPEEVRDPSTFKWIMQNPEYRKQLELMLEGKAGKGFDPRVVEKMRSFDIRSPEVQQQFAQMGMTPEQMVSKIMGDPVLAAAFQNPRIQAAILDVSTNPNNLINYANDREFMEVFMRMQQVFPGQQ